MNLSFTQSAGLCWTSHAPEVGFWLKLCSCSLAPVPRLWAEGCGQRGDSHVQVVNRFDELVEEGHAARDALLKIFNKKIKYSKKKDAGLVGESSSDSSNEDDDDDDEDDEVEDSEGGEETCPPGCDPSLYDKVLLLTHASLTTYASLSLCLLANIRSWQCQKRHRCACTIEHYRGCSLSSPTKEVSSNKQTSRHYRSSLHVYEAFLVAQASGLLGC